VNSAIVFGDFRARSRAFRDELEDQMEKCPVCGQNYGISHSCPGPNVGEEAAVAEWQAPGGFAPGHYLRQAIAVARLNEGAITAASRDPNALPYGAVIWALGQLLLFAGSLLPRFQTLATIHWAPLLAGIAFLVVVDAVAVAAQWGACHLLARWLFDARGTYRGILAPLLLGTIVTWVAVIPVVGFFVAAIWSIAVMMIVFEEVDDIARMQAFGLSFVIGLVVQALLAGLLSHR
jgi:hypothetical protein